MRIMEPILTRDALHHKCVCSRRILSWGLFAVAVNVKERVIVNVEVVAVIFVVVELARKWRLRVAAIAPE